MNLPFFRKRSAPAPSLSSLPSVKTGRSIHSPVALPGHARVLRELADSNRRMLRMYEAAISNNLNTDSPVTISSANAEIFTSILPVRSRARTLERDNPYAWSMLESMRKNVGGHEPFRLEMKVGKKNADGEFIEETETNEKIQVGWKKAGKIENCCVDGVTSRLELDLQAISGMVRDGGILARHWTGFPHNKFRYALQPLEIDRLDHYWNGKNPKTGNDIKMSIEVDGWQRVVGYWLLTRHPGEYFMFYGSIAPFSSTTDNTWSASYREFVPASDLIHLTDIKTRAEQLVGISRFASVIARLHRMDQFDIAHVTAAIWASCKPFFLVQEFPTAMEYVPDFIKKAIADSVESEAGEGEGDKVSNVEPGTGEVLPYGQKPFLVDPKFPIEAAAGFKKDHLRAACTGSGTPYHQIGQDLEGVNFSSGRLGENDYHDTCKILQEHFINVYRRPHFERWLKSAIQSGALDLPMSRYEEFCDAAVFHGRRWPYINPLQDAQADILRIEGGLDSRDHVIQNSERGGDVEQVNAEIAAGRKSDEAHDLDFSSADVTTPTLKKGAPGQTEPNPDDPNAPPEPAKASKKGGKQTLRINKDRLDRVIRLLQVTGNGH